MSNYLWYVNEHRQKLLDEIKKMPDGKNISKIIEEALETYVKVHGSGNPAYSLDKFSDPDFRITPAFGESIEKWKNFIEKSNKQELDEIQAKAISIDFFVKKKYKTGRVY